MADTEFKLNQIVFIIWNLWFLHNYNVVKWAGTANIYPQGKLHLVTL